LPQVSKMILASLQLKNFRNYRKKMVVLTDNTTLIVGDNGAGKTNILEAVYLLATGKSFRATREDQMIFYGENLTRVVGQASEELEIRLTGGQKRYLVNGVGKRRMDFVGILRSVLFRPEDIELTLGSPKIRRDYLDSVLEQTDREYRRSNLSYQKGLRQRNKLLEKIREGEGERKQLIFWDQMLIKNGDIVAGKREEFLGFISEGLAKRGLGLKLAYDKSVISVSRLKQYETQEVAAATTLVGPHRDDFGFISRRPGKAEKNLSLYGSRGEQRIAVFAVKLIELEFVAEKSETRPVLLLDDIFSELDARHRQEVVKLLAKQQTIITATDEAMLPKSAHAEVVRL